jgi:hypothetical protein
MDNQAKVTSIDVLETFRSSLIIFMTNAQRAADEVGDEVRRTRLWLQHDQRMHWETEARKWQKKLDQATQELMSARLSNLRDSTTMQENAVRKAKEALHHAQEKLRAVKIWNRDFDSRMDPLVKRLGSFGQFLGYDMPKALAYLTQAQKTLESYAESTAPRSAPKPPPPAEEKPE